MRFTRIKNGELSLDDPTPWPIYDAEGKLLIKAGTLPNTVPYFETLIDIGLYRDPAESASKRAKKSSLHQTKLKIGNLLQFQKQHDPKNHRYTGTLIGYLKNESFIVTMPKGNGGVLYLNEGQPFIVRFFSGNHAYACTATVLQLHLEPYPHVHFSYPTTLTSLPIRTATRVKLNIPCKAINDAGETKDCTVIDISTKGMAIAVDQALGNTDDKLKLEFSVSVNDEEHQLSLSGVIRSTTNKPKGDGEAASVWHGVAFMDLLSYDKLVVTSLLYKFSVENLDLEEDG